LKRGKIADKEAGLRVNWEKEGSIKIVLGTKKQKRNRNNINKLRVLSLNTWIN